MLLIGVMAMVMAACSSESSTTTDTAEAAPSATTTEAAPETTVPTEPTVTFDGANCVYAGPTTFDLNTLPRFSGVNESEDEFRFTLYHLEDPRLTLEAVIALDADLSGSVPLPDGIRLRSGSSGIDRGAEGGVNLPFTASGDYLIGCVILEIEVEDRLAFLADVVLSVP